MKAVQELRQRQRELHRQIGEARREERRALERAAREDARANMPPEALERERFKDALYADCFSTQAGEMVLADLEQFRPVIADGIKERIERAKAAKPT